MMPYGESSLWLRDHRWSKVGLGKTWKDMLLGMAV